MADIRIKDLATTASTTASDDFMAVDGTTNGTRKLSAATPSFATSVTVPGVSGPTATNLTLAGGSTGASLVLGQGVGAGSSTITNTGTGSLSVVNGDYYNVLTLSRNSSAINTGTTLVFRSKDAGGTYVDIGEFYASKSVATIGAVNSNFAWGTRRAGTLTDAMTLTGSGNLLIGTTTDISGTGGLKVAGTSTASSTTSGALQVGSNVGLSGNAGGASYFGGAVTVTGNAYTNGVNADTFDTNAGSSIASFVGIKGSSASSNTSGIAISNAGLLGFARNAASKDIVSAYLIPSLTVTTSGAEVGRLDINVKPSGNSAYNTNVIRLGGDLSATFAGAVTATGNVVVSNGNLGVGGAVGSFLDILQGGNDAYVYNRRAGSLILGTNNATVLTFGSTGAATFAGAVAIGNTVNTVSPTSPNRTVTMVIGGVTYYLAAKTTND